MAVHLKKRACEEFSHVIQNDETALKRMRLTKTNVSQLPIRIISLSTKEENGSGEKMKELIQFSKYWPLSHEESVVNVARLLELFSKERNSSVRTKIAWLVGNLSKTLKYNIVDVIENIIDLLKKEKSCQVLSQLWSTVLECVRTAPIHCILCSKLVNLACSFLWKKNHCVRSKCLLLIGNLGVIHTSEFDLQTIVGDFFSDPEPRVRCDALRAMVLLHERKQKLEFKVYNQACAALSDDYEAVRIVAIKLMWILSNIFPENMVKVHGTEEKLRLIDDAFIKICDMVNDSSYKVRAAAASLLGSMRLVSSSFLFQTLDKKIMSDLKRKKSLNEKAKEGYVGEFSSGAKWADDAPREIDNESEQLMSGGACGAFVHGLEDEMLEVRTATVDSLTELACHMSNSNFPQASLDFLVDCLNDEIEAVRLNAVNSLHKMMQNVSLLEDQLENVLAGMEDFCVDIREGIHLLLSNCTLTSKFCVNITIMKLLKNLNKYPQDKLSVWKACKHIGKHHSQMVYLLVPHLLSCHPYLDMPEPNMDDPSYIGVLILVFNAAQLYPKMTQMFPEHVIRHYQYLRDSISDLVPQDIRLMTFANGDESFLNFHACRQDFLMCPNKFLNKVLHQVKNMHTHDTLARESLLSCVIDDLRHIANNTPQLSATAVSCASLLQAQLLLSHVVNTRAWTGSTIASTQHLETLRPAARKIVKLTLELQHLFLGLSTNEMSLLLQMRLKAQSLEFLIDLQSLCINKQFSPQQRCLAFFQVIEEVKLYLATHSQIPDSFSKTLFTEALKLEPTRKHALVKLLQPLLQHYSFPDITFSNKVCAARIIINAPVPKSESSTYFFAGLTTAISINATASNLVDPIRNIKVEILYPDMTADIVSLKSEDIKRLNPMDYRIVMKVIVGHQQWTDPCLIKLRFVKVFRNVSPNAIMSIAGVLPLSDSVELSLHPKPVLRV